MIEMFRGLIGAIVLATFAGVVVAAAGGQPAPSVLHITVVLVNAERQATPIPRHALLISDDPPSTSPRRIVTGLDGTFDVRLRPGSYSVESDLPVAFEGQAYQWVQMVQIAAGRDAVLELTAGNAEIGPIGSAGSTAGAAAPADADHSALLAQWQHSVVEIWSPTAHATGFVIGGDGLIATNRRALGSATTAEVQLSGSVKVTATVLAADPVRDVAVLLVNPAVVAALPPVPLGCGQAATPALADDQRIVSIDAPLRQEKGTTPGAVSRISDRGIESDLNVASGGTGGPVFTGDGVIGITSVGDEAAGRRGNTRIVPIAEVCAVVEAARTKIAAAVVPGGTHLPLEPVKPFPLAGLEDGAKRPAVSLSLYQSSTSDFDLTFMTPLVIHDLQQQVEQMSGRTNSRNTRSPDFDSLRLQALSEFGNWSEYVAAVPPVLLIRVTPKLTESLLAKVARGAAYTQGVAVPPIKRFKSGFLRMRTFCGQVEVAPVHPFTIERRVPEGDAIDEGLYAFEPGALGPACGSVKVMVYSEKEPEKGDAEVVDAKVVQQVWQDFAAYREVQ